MYQALVFRPSRRVLELGGCCCWWCWCWWWSCTNAKDLTSSRRSFPVRLQLVNYVFCFTSLIFVCLIDHTGLSEHSESPAFSHKYASNGSSPFATSKRRACFSISSQEQARTCPVLLCQATKYRGRLLDSGVMRTIKAVHKEGLLPVGSRREITRVSARSMLLGESFCWCEGGYVFLVVRDGPH